MSSICRFKPGAQARVRNPKWDRAVESHLSKKRERWGTPAGIPMMHDVVAGCLYTKSALFRESNQMPTSAFPNLAPFTAKKAFRTASLAGVFPEMDFCRLARK